MAVVEMKSLLEAGVHFGHLKKVWNPKMKKYIYSKGDRGDIHIINLDISVGLIEEAYSVIWQPSHQKRLFLSASAMTSMSSVQSKGV